mgnify:CR=1 FL=1
MPHEKQTVHSVIELLPVSQSVIVRCRHSAVARAARAVCMKACIGCGRCNSRCPFHVKQQQRMQEIKACFGK